MRMLVFFDLPVTTASERKNATRFRNFLLKDGYYMVQFSVYSRVCNGNDAVEKHFKRIKENLPPNGSVRLLTITGKAVSEYAHTAGKTHKQRQTFPGRTADIHIIFCRKKALKAHCFQGFSRTLLYYTKNK